MPSERPDGAQVFVSPLFAATGPESVDDRHAASGQARIVMFPASPSLSEYVAASVGIVWVCSPSAGEDSAAVAKAFGAGCRLIRLFGSYANIQTVRLIAPPALVPVDWWRQNWTQSRSFVSSVVGLVVV